MKLRADVVPVADVGDTELERMFRLYANYYQPAAYPKFERDFREKDWALLLRDADAAIRGFTTMMVWSSTVGHRRVRFLFSGDTIIDRAFWGTQALAFRWIEFAGSIKRSDPKVPLYWLLISKGHRTYRYLAAFARSFYPTRLTETPAPLRALMDAAAEAKFGTAYCARRGIIEHDAASVHLVEDIAGAEKHELNPDARFFLERNPGYAEGDELVCLCELSAANLTPMARRQFLRGYGEQSLEAVA